MTVAIDKTVRELAAENPASTRVFEKLGIDYCCGGNQSLREACLSANLQLHEVLDSLEKANQAAPDTQKQRDWQVEPLASLIEHIQNTHHRYTREEIVRLGPLFEKVCSAHGNNHPELLEGRKIFQGLTQELNTHLMKEEMILFPYMLRMQAAVTKNGPIARAPFGSLQNPVSMMEHEHDSAGKALCALNQTTNGYSAPADACVSYQTLYKALALFEADLHEHIHLENNILFPRAVAIEKKMLSTSHRPSETTS
jgi:regulator of cell morphogenesis and NO signaling